eukprot:Skav203684  [mRNA]  locus=scaffold259:122640:126650:+ [translate_table: standard]
MPFFSLRLSFCALLVLVGLASGLREEVDSFFQEAKAAESALQSAHARHQGRQISGLPDGLELVLAQHEPQQVQCTSGDQISSKLRAKLWEDCKRVLGPGSKAGTEGFDPCLKDCETGAGDCQERCRARQMLEREEANFQAFKASATTPARKTQQCSVLELFEHSIEQRICLEVKECILTSEVK